MSRQRFVTLVIAAVLAIAGAMYMSTQRNPRRNPHGNAFLPYLASELDTVTALRMRRASATPTATLHRQNGRWTVAERADYPADMPKLRKLLLALSEAKIAEEKTSNPASFPIIGLEDPSSPGATSAELSLTARDGIHSVIVGKPVGEGNFARRGGESTAYAVEPGISFETEPRFWIDARLIDIPAADIQSIQVRPAAGPAYTVRRDAAGGENFTLDGAPPGRKAAESAMLAPSPTTLTGLTADDVSPAQDIDFGKATVATVTLTDGNVIAITGAISGEKHWIKLHASKDAALSAKAADRAFEIASYRFNAVFRPLEQLLAAKPTPPGKADAVPAKRHPPAPKQAP